RLDVRKRFPVSTVTTSDATDPAAPRSGPRPGGPLKEARALRPLVRSSAVRTERLGTLAPDVVDAFREAGLFWLVVPKECGGGGHDVLTMMETFEEISRSDGSSGWTLMANSLITGLAGSYCGDAAVREIFGGDQLP